MSKIHRRTDQTDKQRKLRKDVDIQYQLFRCRMLEKTKEEIYENCSMIRFYECLHEYFTYVDEIPNEIVENCYMEVDLIHALWHMYLKYEILEVGSWDEIAGMLKTYVSERVKERTDIKTEER